jgi:hypothetical protein
MVKNCNNNGNLDKQSEPTMEEFPNESGFTTEELQDISRMLALKNPSFAADYINWVLDGFHKGHLISSDINKGGATSLPNLLEEMVWSNTDSTGSNNWMIAHNEASKVTTEDGHISLTEFMELLREYGLAVKIHAV